MAAVSMRMLALTCVGLVRTALLVAALVVVSFGLASLIAERLRRGGRSASRSTSARSRSCGRAGSSRRGSYVRVLHQ